MIKRTLGGDRLGSGRKMQVEMNGYERSTFDMSYLFKTTMSAGTLVPFICEVALPGDTFDIDLDFDVMTLPTVGPLFGSFKVQGDVFVIPIRLYNALLHNNTLEVGLDMSKVKLPQIEMTALPIDPDTTNDMDNSQINPSSLLAYLGIRGIGNNTTEENATRTFNALPILMYWDIFKNYYSNKQEKIGAVIHAGAPTITTSVDYIEISNTDPIWGWTVQQRPTITVSEAPINSSSVANMGYITTAPDPKSVYLFTDMGPVSYYDLVGGSYTDNGVDKITGVIQSRYWGMRILNWDYLSPNDTRNEPPQIVTFDLANIDEVRKDILSFWSEVAAYKVNDSNVAPYSYLYGNTNGIPNALSSQEGLAVKTYQSDKFNNWLDAEYLSAISTASAVSTVGNTFTMDQLNLAKKVYELLNRVAVSGGTYEDWIDTVYAHEAMRRAETPVYMGGLSKELVFQSVVSNSQSQEQPLGTLAGRGVLSGKHKGGEIYIRMDEPSYVMGIVSLTPRIDYSQGNKWDVHLQTMDDLHKPALDQIGFQDLVTEQMAWWDTEWDGDAWVTKSAGKQPAWLDYMTNVNKAFGNFAIENNQMFMTLNRRYEYEAGTGIADLTTYIDPAKYNFIFAETSLDAQNFWFQAAVNMIVRRKMSSKVMPNL